MQTELEHQAEGRTGGSSKGVSATAMWFAVLGGPAAWSAHLLVSWSVMEVSCYSLGSAGVVERGGSPGSGAWTTVVLGTAVPWIVAFAALLTCFWVRSRRRRLQRDGAGDGLAVERLGFMLVLGFFLSAMALAAITGGAVALAVLRPCG